MGLIFDNRLQLCIMAKPCGDLAIEGAGGLLVHRHTMMVDDGKLRTVVVYYAFFPEHGCAYLNFVDETSKPMEFTKQQLLDIRQSLSEVNDYLDSLGSSS